MPENVADEVLVLCHPVDKQKHIHEIRNLGIPCQFLEDDPYAEPGRDLLYNTQQSINRHRRLLLILSDQFLEEKNGWLIFQVILAIQKCQLNGECCLVLLLVRDMEEDLIPKIPILDKAKILKLSKNQYTQSLKTLKYCLKGKSGARNWFKYHKF